MAVSRADKPHEPAESTMPKMTETRKAMMLCHIFRSLLACVTPTKTQKEGDLTWYLLRLGSACYSRLAPDGCMLCA